MERSRVIAIYNAKASEGIDNPCGGFHFQYLLKTYINRFLKKVKSMLLIYLWKMYMSETLFNKLLYRDFVKGNSLPVSLVWL